MGESGRRSHPTRQNTTHNASRLCASTVRQSERILEMQGGWEVTKGAARPQNRRAGSALDPETEAGGWAGGRPDVSGRQAAANLSCTPWKAHASCYAYTCTLHMHRTGQREGGRGVGATASAAGRVSRWPAILYVGRGVSLQISHRSSSRQVDAVRSRTCG